MKHILTIHLDNAPIYNIIFTNNLIQIFEQIYNLGYKERNICIVIDTNVSNYYMPNLNNIAKDNNKISFKVIQAGEQYKNTQTIEDIYEHLITNHFDRNDLLIAFGGGVTGDMTGYAAATYLRGISFIQIPTTLLAMVDSSIGGKTGVDWKGYKNMIGAFHMPKAVFINTNLLKTLPKRELHSGYAEIIKHALIYNVDYIKKLQESDHAIISDIIYESCIIKKNIVETDPKELSIRALLNFGHTIGHAIEKYMDFSLLHGECVSLGIVCASYISMKRNYIDLYEFSLIEDLLVAYDLPIRIQAHIDPLEILSYTKSDKKTDGKVIKFILLQKLGHAYIDTSVCDQEILESIQYIIGEHHEN